MLSRVADHLYWMGRYLERAEHSARLLEVNLHGNLDQSERSEERRWRRLARSLGMELQPEMWPSFDALGQALTLDAAIPESILSRVKAARDNARQGWEQISSEMWEQINRMFLYLDRSSATDVWLEEPQTVFNAVKQGAYLFQGITDATMSHGEGWQFIQVGRATERAVATARLLDVHFCQDGAAPKEESLSFLEWAAVLKSCTAFEAYVKTYSAQLEPSNIAAFLLLNPEFPRSIRFSTSSMKSGLHAIGRMAGGRMAGRPERLAGRLQADLDYGQIDEIMSGGLDSYLESIRHQCEQIHRAVHETFIRYPVATALAAQHS